MSDSIGAEGESGVERSPRLEELARRVRDMKHTMNGPLTAIMAEVELLLLDVDDLKPDQKRGLVAIAEQARRLANLIAELKEVE